MLRKLTLLGTLAGLLAILAGCGGDSKPKDTSVPPTKDALKQNKSPSAPPAPSPPP